MTKEDKELKVHFAPGCFDSFEGTQEELDELVKEIQEMFANKSPEEIQADSRELTEEDWDELPEDAKIQIFRTLVEDNDTEEEKTRRLQ